MRWPALTRTKPLGLAVIFLVSLGGCVAPQYDDQTDKLISQLQADVDTEFATLISLDHQIASLTKKAEALNQRISTLTAENSAGAASDLAAAKNGLALAEKNLADAKTKAGYDANVAFYIKVDVSLVSLQTRIDAEPNLATPRLDTAIAKLRDNLLADKGSLQAAHQLESGIIAEAQLRLMQQLIDAQLSSLLTYELQLKSGSGATGGAAK